MRSRLLLLLLLSLACTSAPPPPLFPDPRELVPAKELATAVRLAFAFDTVIAERSLGSAAPVLTVRIADAGLGHLNDSQLSDTLTAVARWLLTRADGKTWSGVSLSWTATCTPSAEFGGRTSGLILSGKSLAALRKETRAP